METTSKTRTTRIESTELILRAQEYLKEKLKESNYYVKYPEQLTYRFEHSIRVAKIGYFIAKEEAMPTEDLTLACLLHDVAYCKEFESDDDWLNHGRESADIALNFLLNEGLEKSRSERIAHAISLHVDDKSHMKGEDDAFSKSVADSDNVDRFDVYRIHENLQYNEFTKKNLSEKLAFVEKVLEDTNRLKKVTFATKTAEKLFKERLEYKYNFFLKLKEQLLSGMEIE